MKELEVLAALAGYRVQDVVQVDGVWTVILDDEHGETLTTGATAQEAVEKMIERLARLLNRYEQ